MKTPTSKLRAASKLLVASAPWAVNRVGSAEGNQLNPGRDGPTGLDNFWWPNHPHAALGPNPVMVTLNGVRRISPKGGAPLGGGYVGRVFFLLNPSVARRDPNIRFHLRLTKSNLPPVTGTPVATNAADTNGGFQFTDPQTANYPQRPDRITRP